MASEYTYEEYDDEEKNTKPEIKSPPVPLRPSLRPSLKPSSLTSKPSPMLKMLSTVPQNKDLEISSDSDDNKNKKKEEKELNLSPPSETENENLDISEKYERYYKNQFIYKLNLYKCGHLLFNRSKFHYFLIINFLFILMLIILQPILVKLTTDKLNNKCGPYGAWCPDLGLCKNATKLPPQCLTIETSTCCNETNMNSYLKSQSFSSYIRRLDALITLSITEFFILILIISIPLYVKRKFVDKPYRIIQENKRTKISTVTIGNIDEKIIQLSDGPYYILNPTYREGSYSLYRKLRNDSVKQTNSCHNFIICFYHVIFYILLTIFCGLLITYTEKPIIVDLTKYKKKMASGLLVINIILYLQAIYFSLNLLLIDKNDLECIPDNINEYNILDNYSLKINT